MANSYLLRLLVFFFKAPAVVVLLLSVIGAPAPAEPLPAATTAAIDIGSRPTTEGNGVADALRPAAEINEDGTSISSVSCEPRPHVVNSTPLSSADEVDEEVAASMAAIRLILCSSFLVLILCWPAVAVGITKTLSSDVVAGMGPSLSVVVEWVSVLDFVMNGFMVKLSSSNDGKAAEVFVPELSAIFSI